MVLGANESGGYCDRLGMMHYGMGLYVDHEVSILIIFLWTVVEIISSGGAELLIVKNS